MSWKIQEMKAKHLTKKKLTHSSPEEYFICDKTQNDILTVHGSTIFRLMFLITTLSFLNRK